jgi:DNA-binding response OmpR family regulator
VLLVDDDTVATQQFARILKLEGYTVDMAFDGDTALRMTARQRPDVLLVDLRMPTMDGLAFLRAFETTYGRKRVPTALITGDVFLDAAEEREAIALGARIIFKPIWTDQLLGLVKSLLVHG